MKTADALARMLIEVAGYAWIVFIGQVIGLALLALVVGGFRTRGGSGGPSLGALLAISVMVLPVGALLLLAPVLSLWEQLGPLKGGLCQVLVLAAFGLFVAPLAQRYLRDKARPAPGASSAHDAGARAAFATQTCAEPTSWAKRAAAASGNLVVVAGAMAAHFGRDILWFDTRSATLLMSAEFLVIHMGFFLGFVFIVRPTIRPGKGLQWFLFVSILCFYLRAVVGRHWADALPYLWAALGTYGGFLLGFRRPDAFFQLLKRWAASLLLFMALALAFRMESTINNWHQDRHVLPLTAVYFAALGTAEALALYDRRWRWPWKRRQAT